MPFKATPMLLAASVLLASGLGGCASIITGTSQDIAIATTPGGARCVLTREKETIATVDSTPGTVTVRKDKHDILVTCDKAGYQTATKYLDSDVEAGTFGNIILGGVVGWGIDSATGADNKYDETVSIPLVATTTAAKAPAAAPATGTTTTQP
jgi:hypothetical protein